MPVVVGVDLGSGAARAVAVDPDGALLGESVAPFAGASTWPAGRADPRAWLAAFEDAVARLGHDVPAASRPAALAIGGQSPTTVASGSQTLAITHMHPAGATFDPHRQHDEQHAVLRAEIGSVAPMQLWDWVLGQLGAPRAQGRWPGDPELRGYGPVVPTGTASGHADGTHGVPEHTPLVPGAQDAYLAFWAAGIDEPGRALDPGGRTGGLGVAVAAGRRPADMFALPAAARGIDIVGGPVSAHGLVLEWWAKMTSRSVDELLVLAADVPPGASGVHALPYLEGERAPRWNRELRAEIRGLRSAHGPAEVARALLESTAYGLAHIARELAAAGVPTNALVVGGQPARSALWCAIKAAVLEVPLEVPEHPELAAYGSALAAGAAVGWWPAPGAGRSGDWPRPKVRVVAPEPDAVYRAGYERFVELGDEAVRRLAHPREQEEACRTR
jgi:sugar (pentulose or hexulose) kinase